MNEVICLGTMCLTDADCPIGNICWALNCCGHNICVQASDVCNNTLLARNMFVRVRRVGLRDVSGTSGKEA